MKKYWLVIVFFIVLFVLICTMFISPLRGRAGLFRAVDSNLMVIRTGGLISRKGTQEIQLYESSNNDEIKKIIDEISFRPMMIGLHCLCGLGSMTFDFYKDDKVLQTFSLCHGKHLKMARDSYGDYYLTEKSIKWFDAWLSSMSVMPTC